MAKKSKRSSSSDDSDKKKKVKENKKADSSDEHAESSEERPTKRRRSTKTPEYFDPTTHVAMPDKKFHDTRTAYKMQLPRNVESTKWNDRSGLTGRDPFDICLREFLCGGKTGMPYAC